MARWWVPLNKKGAEAPCLQIVARPERFELPTTKFVAWCSIQLSYGRAEEGKYERKQTGRQRLMAIKSDSVKP